MFRDFTARCALLLICLCMFVSQALAQALAIVPISQQLPPQQRTASFTLTNHSDSEALVQVRGYAWSQTGSDETYTPTTELAVSPPFAKIAPGQNQVVRILLRTPAGMSEKAYRVFFDQIPDRFSGKVEMALRLTVPVFSSAQPPGKPEVEWRLEREGVQPILVAINHGKHHAKLLNLSLTGSDGRAIRLKGMGLPYLLSGTQRRWPLQGVDGSSGKSTRLHLQTSGPAEQRWDQWLEIRY
ncbi:fimbrial biogenesis chaperone [Pseudomonas syringae]|uniref:fimbrial biogenesis chaperone n=1 Tax=Pseudomonas syringae TaxID=317 RepID=UPI003F753D8D